MTAGRSTAQSQRMGNRARTRNTTPVDAEELSVMLAVLGVLLLIFAALMAIEDVEYVSLVALAAVVCGVGAVNVYAGTLRQRASQPTEAQLATILHMLDDEDRR